MARETARKAKNMLSIKMIARLGLMLALTVAAILVFQIRGFKPRWHAQEVPRLAANAGVSQSADVMYRERPLSFEPNVGQADPHVRFVSRGLGYHLVLRADEVDFSLWERSTKEMQRPQSGTNELRTAQSRNISTVQMLLAGANHHSEVEGLDLLPGQANYLIGSDRTKWRRDIPTYGRVKCHDIYPGIDVMYYGNQRQLEYDFVVAPNADPKNIRLVFKGAESIQIEPSTGDLLVKMANGAELRQARPRIYQQIQNQKRGVSGEYQMVGQETVAFAVADYDHRNPLIIDPTVEFTTFIAGSAEDFPISIAVDGSGNSYITGFTLSNDFPLILNTDPYAKNCTLVEELTFNGSLDNPATFGGCNEEAFVAVLSPNGTLLTSTYIFGPGYDHARAIAVDSQGVYIAGITNSPSGTNQIDLVPTPGKFGNAFVLKLDSAAHNLEWVTELGGENGSTEAFSIALDSTHAAYIAGTTCSPDFRTTGYFPQGYRITPWQGVLKGDCDAFAAKIDYLGHPLYATYLGGSSLDSAQSIAVDNQGYAYVTGSTCSPDFPAVNGELLKYGYPGEGCGAGQSGGSTAFVTKILPDGSGGLYSILLGGRWNPENVVEGEVVQPFALGTSIAVDAIGEAYVTGVTRSTDFFTTSGVIQNSYPAPPGAAFVARVSPLGTVLYSTFLGSTQGETEGHSIALNALGQIYVAGSTSSSTGFPGAPVNAPKPNPNEGFLTKLSPTLDAVSFTTFLGDNITAIAIPRAHSLFSVILAIRDTEVYTTGVRFRPGPDDSANDLDGFVVRVSDSLVNALL
jgi:Beta-propeller repeat